MSLPKKLSNGSPYSIRNLWLGNNDPYLTLVSENNSHLFLRCVQSADSSDGATDLGWIDLPLK